MTRMTTAAGGWERARPWLPDALAGAGVFLIALWEVTQDRTVTSAAGGLLVVTGLALAVASSRRAPGVALAVAWAVGLVHLVTGTGPLVSEVLLAVVAFGCARWGGSTVVWLSGVSIPLGAAVAVLWLDPNVFYDSLRVAGVQVLARRAYDGTDSWRLPAALLGAALLMAPWLLGLALRFSAGSQASRRSQVEAEAERDQAEEIARLRDDQTRLARDVHDVVGHSLAVILAQAESAQYLEDGDTAALKQTMANIATSARSSLEDVRTVLSATPGTKAATVTRQHDLDALVDGVRASGHVVESTVVGDPQPMPPELEVVAFRVLQEMLTNAIKYGRRDEPVVVERHWDGDLRIEVQNAVAEQDAPDETQPITGLPIGSPDGGQGIEGMRRRLEAAGGRLDVRRRTDPPTFTATAWVPVRVAS
jgi:signal transduction histidine kinase